MRRMAGGRFSFQPDGLRKSFTLALTASSILMSGDHGLLKPSPANLRGASIPSFVRIAISEVAWAKTSAGSLVTIEARCGSVFAADEERGHSHHAEAERSFNVPNAALEEALVNANYHRSYEEREPGEVQITPLCHEGESLHEKPHHPHTVF